MPLRDPRDLLAALKRRMRSKMSKECYREALEVIQEFEAWLEEEAAEQIPI